jgi:hypothetical protein
MSQQRVGWYREDVADGGANYLLMTQERLRKFALLRFSISIRYIIKNI